MTTMTSADPATAIPYPGPPPGAPPPVPPPPPADRPRRLRAYRTDDVLSLLGAGAASLCLAWLLYARILPLFGLLGFILFWYALFLLSYATVTGLGNPRPVVIDRLVAAVVYGGAVLVGIALVSTVFFTFYRGIRVLPHPNMFTQDMGGVRPEAPLNRGGVLHAIVGSLIELSIAVAVSLPLGVGTAVYMTEVGGRFARVVRTVIEAMTALPDILAGLFVYVVLVVGLHFPKSGFAAALALSVTMLPIIARAADVVLRVVPGGLREAGLALGASHWQVVWRVVLPTARPGLATALILGVARGVGETAPVLLTSGASTFLNPNPVEGSMNSLPLFVFAAVRSGQPLFISRGFAGASILLAMVLVLFAVTRWLARPKVGNR
jgi:phosphate transport system permease protein